MVRWLPLRKFWERFPVYLRPFLASLPILLVTIYLYQESRNSERLLLEAETAHQADNVVLQFQSLIGTRLATLRDAGNFVLASPGAPGSQNFAPFVKNSLADMPDMDAIFWMDAKGTVLQEVRARRPGALRFAPLSNEVQRDLLKKAAASRQPVAGGSFELGPGQQGLVITVPVIRDGQLEYFVTGVVRLTQAIGSLNDMAEQDFWNLEINDRSGRNAYRSATIDDGAPRPLSRLVAERHVPVADRAWKIRIWPTPLMIATLHTPAPQRILGIGLVASLILWVANFLLAQRQASLSASLQESERLSADIEATRRHLSDLVNGIEAVIWESDADVRRFTFVNDYARKLLGIDIARWINEPDAWFEHVHPDDRERARESSRAAMQPGHIYPVEYRVIDDEGRELWVREIITAMGENGRTVGRRGIIVDITARVRAEEAVRQSQKLESLGVLAGGIAHDFNNLLTTILGNAEMLSPFLSGSKSPGKPYLEKIERTTRRLAELTRQMLAYSGRGQFSIDQVDLNAIITEMTELLTVSTPKNVKVTYRLDPCRPILEGDQVQMRQVVLNLSTNAAEAIGDQPDGRVMIRTDTCALDDAGAADLYPGQEVAAGRYVRLEVSDNGCGMDAETLSKIFDPFFTTKFAGRGLGLAALRGIVRGHRGGIRIFSQPGEGTVFTLIFPASSGRVRQTVAGHNGDHGLWRIEDAKILMIDDEEALRSLMALALEEAGCTVFQASDGEEGMEEFCRHGHEIDVVVLDLTMPRLSGNEVFRRIRAARPETRVILCSGYTEDDIREQFAGQGLSGFIEKPFTPSELIEKISRVLAGGVSGKKRPAPLPSQSRI